MPAFNFPSVGTVSAAGYSGPAGGYNAYQVQNSPLARASAAAAGSGSTATTLSPTPAPDTALLQSITSDVGSLNAEATRDAADAEASTTQSEGYGKEIDAYNAVGAIAGQNATIEGVAGNIRQLQANRLVNTTVGAQRAAVASAGFAQSGSSLDLMKSSIQQGYMTDQIIRTQTAVQQGGYLEQGAAAQAEASGARVASDAALSLAKSQAAAGQLAAANAANETAALNAYIASTGGVNSPARALVTNAVSADPSQPTTFTPPTTTPAQAANRGPAYAGGIGTPYVG